MYFRSSFSVVLLAVVTLVVSVESSASAARRVALVIGNDNYQNLVKLRTAVADAKSYVDFLQSRKFDQVIFNTDLTRSQMDEVIASFVDQLQPGDTALFAYSGHGWSDGTQNYIVGIDAPSGGSQDFLARISVPLKNGANGIIDEMDAKGATLKVIIIDACRDNPFTPPPGKRDIGLARGLTRIAPPSGTFVIFSAAAGQSALDRLSDSDTDPNSVFTRVFVPAMRANTSLLDAIKKTQQDVVSLARSIRAEQKPAYYDEVVGTACLSASCDDDHPSANPPPKAASGPSAADAELAYDKAVLANTIPAYDEFISKYPESDQAKKALKLIEILSDEQSWHDATNANSIDRHLLYLAQHAEGTHADDARFRIARLRSDEEARQKAPAPSPEQNPANAAVLPQSVTSGESTSSALATEAANDFFRNSSLPPSDARTYLEKIYAPVIDYFGQPKSKESVIAEKMAYMIRWPDRSYSIDSRSVSATCDAEGKCQISGIVVWRAHSEERKITSEGTARFRLTFTTHGTPTLSSEWSEVVTRSVSRG
jgi:hypothetical protein